jgi:pimeloyl-ACP methyl ester carboxylesterase
MSRWLRWQSELPFAPKAFLELTTHFFERGVLPVPDYAGIPVHILYSDNDPVAPWETHGQRLLDLIPHATSAAITGAGHWLQFEMPEECVNKTLQFFARERSRSSPHQSPSI